MRLYKWMLPGLRTALQEKEWPVAVGEWTPAETPVLCESGWHATEEKDALTHLPDGVGAELWVVERRGAVVKGDDKFAAESLRLVHHVGTTDEVKLRLFAADCAGDVLYLFEEELPGDDRPRRAIEAARAYARGEVGAAARDAAGAAAWAAAGAAAGTAARAAAWAAAGTAARDAAGDAAGYAAGYAAWAAAGAAAATAAGDAAATAAWDAAWAVARPRYSNWLVVRLWGGEDENE
jgi:hypothetical protein